MQPQCGSSVGEQRTRGVRTCVTRGNSIKCPRDAEQNCPSAPKRGGRRRRRLGCWSLTVSFPCSPGYVEMQVRRTRRRILVWADAQLGVSRAPSGRGRGHGALLLGQGIHRWGLRGPRRCQRGSSGGIRRRPAAPRSERVSNGRSEGRCWIRKVSKCQKFNLVSTTTPHIRQSSPGRCRRGSLGSTRRRWGRTGTRECHRRTSARRRGP